MPSRAELRSGRADRAESERRSPEACTCCVHRSAGRLRRQHVAACREAPGRRRLLCAPARDLPGVQPTAQPHLPAERRHSAKAATATPAPEVEPPPSAASAFPGPPLPPSPSQARRRGKRVPRRPFSGRVPRWVGPGRVLRFVAALPLSRFLAFSASAASEQLLPQTFASRYFKIPLKRRGERKLEPGLKPATSRGSTVTSRSVFTSG